MKQRKYKYNPNSCQLEEVWFWWEWIVIPIGVIMLMGVGGYGTWGLLAGALWLIGIPVHGLNPRIAAFCAILFVLWYAWTLYDEHRRSREWYEHLLSCPECSQGRQCTYDT